MVGVRGFEPPASASRTQRSSQAEPHPDRCTTLYRAVLIIYHVFGFLQAGKINFFAKSCNNSIVERKILLFKLQFLRLPPTHLTITAWNQTSIFRRIP